MANGADREERAALQVGQRWRHYKGGLYEILMLGIAESNGEDVVIYRACDGRQETVWVRSVKDFMAAVPLSGVRETYAQRFSIESGVDKLLESRQSAADLVKNSDVEFCLFAVDKRGNVSKKAHASTAVVSMAALSFAKVAQSDLP